MTGDKMVTEPWLRPGLFDSRTETGHPMTMRAASARITAHTNLAMIDSGHPRRVPAPLATGPWPWAPRRFDGHSSPVAVGACPVFAIRSRIRGRFGRLITVLSHAAGAVPGGPPEGFRKVYRFQSVAEGQ